MKKGFSLVELLTVVGVISVLMGLAAAGYGYMASRAQRVKTQELVSNAATALTLIFQESKSWPKPIRDGHGQHKLTADVCNAFVRHGSGLLGISYVKDGDRRVVDPNSPDRFGLVDSYAQKLIRNNKNISKGAKVPSGGTIDDHILRFAVDLDGDGITELPEGRRVRATACVWSLGADGVEGQSRSKSDDVYSWNQRQEVR